MLVVTAWCMGKAARRDLTRKKFFNYQGRVVYPSRDTLAQSLNNQLQGATSAERVIFPFELGSICREIELRNHPSESGINEVNKMFMSKYMECFNRLSPTGNIPSDTLNTRLVFVGYDPLREVFFQKSCLFIGTNQPVLETRYERDSKCNQSDISFQGEGKFLPVLLTSSDSRFVKLRTSEFTRTAKDLEVDTSVISDDQAVEFILDLFRLHKTYAASFGLDKGLIGGPYVIYKITRTGVLKLH